jgi:hypothetical protein
MDVLLEFLEFDAKSALGVINKRYLGSQGQKAFGLLSNEPYRFVAHRKAAEGALARCVMENNRINSFEINIAAEMLNDLLQRLNNPLAIFDRRCGMGRRHRSSVSSGTRCLLEKLL